MKYYLSFFACFLITFFAQAQVTGIVYDAETREPLEYVTVFCKEEGRGTITNKEGKFSLLLNNSESIVTFSFIGYNTVKMQLTPNIKINLQPAVIELDEIEIKPITEDIGIYLWEVWRKSKKNYHPNTTICDIHLKQFDLLDGKYIKSINMTGEMEIPKFKQIKETDKFRLSPFSADLFIDTTILFFLPFSPESFFISFRNPIVILKYLWINAKKYHFDGAKIYQDNSVIYKIDFSPKETEKLHLYSGTFFIDEESKAILQFRIYLEKPFNEEINTDLGGENLVLRYQEQKARVNYLKINEDKYLMNYLIVSNRFMLNDKPGSINLVISTTNFTKDTFCSPHLLDNSSDLYGQLDSMDIPKTKHYENGIIPTENELEFFERKKK